MHKINIRKYINGKNMQKQEKHHIMVLYLIIIQNGVMSSKPKKLDI